MNTKKFAILAAVMAGTVSLAACNISINTPAVTPSTVNDVKTELLKVIKGLAMVPRNVTVPSAYRTNAVESSEMIPAPKGYKVTLDDPDGKTLAETTVYDDAGHYELKVDPGAVLPQAQDSSVGIVTVRNLAAKAIACAPMLLERLKALKDDKGNFLPTPAPSPDLMIDAISTVMALNTKASLADGKDVKDFINDFAAQRRKYELDAGFVATGKALMEAAASNQGRVDALIGAPTANNRSSAIFDQMNSIAHEAIDKAIASGEAVPPGTADLIDNAMINFSQAMGAMPALPVSLTPGILPSGAPIPGTWKPMPYPTGAPPYGPYPTSSSAPNAYPSGWSPAPDSTPRPSGAPGVLPSPYPFPSGAPGYPPDWGSFPIPGPSLTPGSYPGNAASSPLLPIAFPSFPLPTP